MYYAISLFLCNLLLIATPYNYFYLEDKKDKLSLISCINFYICMFLMFLNAEGLYYITFQKKYELITYDDRSNLNLSQLIFIYQIFNSIYDICKKNYLQLIHHFSIILSNFVVFNGYMLSFASFYYYYTEISTIFLTNKEVFKIYRIRNETIKKVNQNMFVMTFIFFRNIIYINFYLQLCFVLFNKNNIEIDPIYFYSVLISHNTLSFLQYFWGYKIIKKIIF